MRALPDHASSTLKARAKRVLDVAARFFRAEPTTQATEALMVAMSAWRLAYQLHPGARRDLFVATASNLNDAIERTSAIALSRGKEIDL